LSAAGGWTPTLPTTSANTAFNPLCAAGVGPTTERQRIQQSLTADFPGDSAHMVLVAECLSDSFSAAKIHLQRTRPHLSRQQRRQCKRPQRSRQQRRQDTSVKSLRWAVIPAGGGTIGAAGAVPETAAKIKPAKAITNIGRNMCLSLFSNVKTR
jgi:hypothetical protein